MLLRRTVLAAAIVLPFSAKAAGFDIGDLEKRIEGRIGVAVRSIGTGKVLLAHRADERFPLSSSFKFALAAFVLSLADRGRLKLTEELAFSRADLVPYSPTIEANLGVGRMSIAALCGAIITVSDNAAANLLFRRTGGPVALTAWLRSQGDPTTRLDRWETELNLHPPGEVRDTTSPRAMSGLCRTLAFGAALKPASREQLRRWMIENQTGAERLRAGLPKGWIAGDKMGTSGKGANSDVAFALPPGFPAKGWTIASYIHAPESVRSAQANPVHAEIARRVAAVLG